MIKKKKVLQAKSMPEFNAGIASMPEDSKIFVDKSLEIAHYIFQLMEQKEMNQKALADKMGKSEAEISKLLGGMHNFTLRSIAKIEAALNATVICTPRNLRVSFPENASVSSAVSTVTEPAPSKEIPKLDYTPVVQMYGAYPKLSESLII